MGSQSPVDELEGVEEAGMAADMLTGEELVSKVSGRKRACVHCVCARSCVCLLDQLVMQCPFPCLALLSSAESG
mgnify:CR=1 FL=1